MQSFTSDPNNILHRNLDNYLVLVLFWWQKSREISKMLSAAKAFLFREFSNRENSQKDEAPQPQQFQLVDRNIKEWLKIQWELPSRKKIQYVTFTYAYLAYQ